MNLLEVDKTLDTANLGKSENLTYPKENMQLKNNVNLRRFEGYFPLIPEAAAQRRFKK